MVRAAERQRWAASKPAFTRAEGTRARSCEGVAWNGWLGITVPPPPQTEEVGRKSPTTALSMLCRCALSAAQQGHRSAYRTGLKPCPSSFLPFRKSVIRIRNKNVDVLRDSIEML
jgi:hypothetical protein